MFLYVSERLLPLKDKTRTGNENIVPLCTATSKPLWRFETRIADGMKQAMNGLLITNHNHHFKKIFKLYFLFSALGLADFAQPISSNQLSRSLCYAAFHSHGNWLSFTIWKGKSFRYICFKIAFNWVDTSQKFGGYSGKIDHNIWKRKTHGICRATSLSNTKPFFVPINSLTWASLARRRRFFFWNEFEFYIVIFLAMECNTFLLVSWSVISVHIRQKKSFVICA